MVVLRFGTKISLGVIAAITYYTKSLATDYRNIASDIDTSSSYKQLYYDPL